MYPFMTLPVHFNTVFLISVKLDPSTVLLFYISTDLPVHQYTCSVYFLFFGISYAKTFQLIYWSTYPQIHPKINVPVYPHASLSSNHKDLPVTTTISIRFYCTTCPQMYLFITILFCMSTDVPDHLYTCSVYFFFFGITCTVTFHLIAGYLPTDPPENKFTCLPSCFSFA